MSENVSITVKVGNQKTANTFTVAETVRASLTIAAGEASTVAYELPGLADHKFIIVIAEGSVPSEADPIEVRVDAADAYPIACSPVAVLTADTIGGFSAAGAPTPPIDLYFNNPQAQPVTVNIIAGG